MADFADIASDYSEQVLQRTLDARPRFAVHSTLSAEYCEECGVSIPQARREAVPGCELCVDCQALHEVRRG